MHALFLVKFSPLSAGKQWTTNFNANFSRQCVCEKASTSRQAIKKIHKLLILLFPSADPDPFVPDEVHIQVQSFSAVLILAKHLIQEITVKTDPLPHPAELSIILEEAYLRFLHQAPGDLLARLLLTLSLGIRIGWVTASMVPPRKALIVGFVETVGNFSKQSWDDWEPDLGLADYVPDGDQSPLLSIDQYYEHWHVAPPTDLVSKDGKQDSRRAQFERLIASTPGLRVLAISTLEARVDASARKKFLEIANEWLYCYWERQSR